MSWSRITLGDVVEIKHGFAFKSEFFSDVGDYLLLTPGNCHESGGLKLKGEPFAKFVVEHDILLANLICHS